MQLLQWSQRHFLQLVKLEIPLGELEEPPKGSAFESLQARDRSKVHPRYDQIPRELQAAWQLLACLEMFLP